MKIKDLERTANIAWSPKNQHPILLAAGTAAQQLDASFNTNAALELYSLNLTDPGLDVELKSSVSSEHRFHKIVWGPFGKDQSNSTIIGGCDGGIIQIYNVDKLLKNEPALVASPNKHSGPVYALDFNPFQSNLLGTGSSNSEILIWDLNNTSTPMTPGAKSQPFEDVLSMSWNRQVQHILASTFASKCVVWDLRKNEPIIKLTDTVSRIRWKVVAWHPEVATQLCLASEEDQAPVIQVWDLRFATSPLKTLENHRRGVLSIAWCNEDSDLLVSCGKDNRILCWNPNSNQPGGEVLSEIAKTNQWNFDLAWCSRNPALIACPSFDGHVSVYSLMGGKTQQVQTTNKIADSFPGMDGYIQAPVPQQSAVPVSVDLSKPPKWLKRPVGASFGFGGKLIQFENDKTQIAQLQQNIQPGQPIPAVPRTVFISQVITESELVEKSMHLEQALEYGNFTDYCLRKAENITDQHKRFIWYFLKANFEEKPRTELLNLLGYKIEDVNAKLSQYVGDSQNNEVDSLNEQFSNLNRNDYSDGEINISSNDSPDLSPGYDNPIGFEQLANISQKLETKKPVAPYAIKTGNDTEGLITQAVLLGNVNVAVELCLKAKRYADAIIIAMTGGSELLARTQYKYLEQSDGYLSSLISALVSEDWASVINNCEINSWKEALAATLTHSSDEDLPNLCEQLGCRLERESATNPKLADDAQLCYICAGSFEKLVSSWSKDGQHSSDDLQELVELVTFLQKAVERQGRRVEISGSLADLLSQYASILVSQGSLLTAVKYLGNSQNEQISNLRDRIYISLGQKPIYAQTRRARTDSSRQSLSNYNNPYMPTNQFSPAFNQFHTGLPNANANQPWQTQTTNFAPPVPMPPKPYSPGLPTAPPSQPPRPTSVGSANSGSGITTRSKYIVDPSVQSSGAYGTRNQFSGGYQPQAFNPAPNQFQTNALTSPVNPYMTNAPTPLQNPGLPNPPVTPGAMPNAGFPIQAQPSFQPQAVQNSSNPQLDIAQQAMHAFNANAPPGWNDPPPLSKAARAPQPKQDFASQEPITHPLYGTAPVQNVPNSNGFNDQNNSIPYGQVPSYGQSVAPPANPQMFQPPPMNNNFGQQGSFNTQPIGHGGFNDNAINPGFQTAPASQAVVEKPQPVQKLPIPDEHKIVQTVFEELRHQCSSAAQNPQTKRKLDDVAKKLESLYDLLREQKLSPNTLSALHQLVQLVKTSDYMNGLNLHTQLVSGPDFSQIASFMPGLKVLLQSAMQLQVYLR